MIYDKRDSEGAARDLGIKEKRGILREGIRERKEGIGSAKIR
jgi:hypothetical protein